LNSALVLSILRVLQRTADFNNKTAETHHMSTRIRSFGILFTLIVLGGCASGVTRTDSHAGSVFKPSADIPINKVTVSMTDDVRTNLKDSTKFNQEDLRNTIQNTLAINKLYAAQNPASISLDVVVTRVRVRSTFNAIMWGAMAGNDAIEGNVTVKDSTGKVIDKFGVNTSYALGGFAGGQDGSRLGWLDEAFAKQVLAQFDGEAEAQAAKNKKKKKHA
jgi:hypothetical protein